jgi:hypothetical protein
MPGIGFPNHQRYCQTEFYMDGWSWFFGSVLLLCGASFIYHGYRTRETSKRALRWPTVHGTITESDTEKSTLHRRGSRLHVATVRYEYAVAGTTYRNDKIAIGGELSMSSAAARRRAASYAVGLTTMVHFNPADPSEAYLETAPQGAAISWLGGILGVGLGLALILGLFPAA